MKIPYPKVKGQGHQRGQGHSKNKKCGKFDETCGELKISFSKFPYKFDIFEGLVIFDYSGALTSAVFSVEHPQLMREQNTLQIKVLLLR